MRKILIIIVSIFLLFVGCTYTNQENTRTQDQNKQDDFDDNFLYSGGVDDSKGLEIRNIKISRWINEERIIIEFFHYATDRNAVRAKVIPKFDINFNSNNKEGKLAFRYEVGFRAINPDLSKSKYIEQIVAKQEYEGEPTEIDFVFKPYTKFKIEEKSSSGKLIIHIKSQ